MNILGMQSDYGIHWYSFLLLFVPLTQRLIWDLHTIEVEKKEVNHKLHTAMTAGLMLVVAVIIHILEPATWWKALALQIAIFFMLFDYALNLARGLNIFYIDRGLDGISSNTDTIWNHIGVWPQLALKLWVMLLGVSIYFLWSYTGW